MNDWHSLSPKLVQIVCKQEFLLDFDGKSSIPHYLTRENCSMAFHLTLFKIVIRYSMLCRVYKWNVDCILQKIESNYSSRSLTPPLFTSSALLYFEKNAIHCPLFVSSTEVQFCAFFNHCQKQLYLVSKQKFVKNTYAFCQNDVGYRNTSLKITKTKTNTISINIL